MPTPVELPTPKQLAMSTSTASSPAPSTTSSVGPLSFRASVEDVALVWDSLAQLHAHDVTFDIVTSTLHIDGLAEEDLDPVIDSIHALIGHAEPVCEPASP